MADEKVYEGYCVKCRVKREFVGTATRGPSGRHMAVGKCPVCGAGMNRLLPNPDKQARSTRVVGGDGPEDLKALFRF